MEDLELVDSMVGALPNFWQGKRVLITGHTGFKGAWMAIWLHRLGARVSGVSLPPRTTPNLFDLADVRSICDTHLCDIRNADALALLLHKAQPEIVFHLAAQALVRAGYRDPLSTFATNVQGTVNLLEGLRLAGSVRVLVAVTSDKVYKNHEHFYPYRETDELGGHDPYSASKAASEIIVSSYRDSFLKPMGIAVGTARAGNVIGGGDWSEDRLIPDAIRAWGLGETLHIRRPQAVRPWQHVLEPLAGYIKFAERLWYQPELAGPYNFGPPTNEVVTVRELVQMAKNIDGNGQVTWGNGAEGPHEAGLLYLETTKARSLLSIEPRWLLPEAVSRTMNWYIQHRQGANVGSLCLSDIADYEFNQEQL